MKTLSFSFRVLAASLLTLAGAFAPAARAQTGVVATLHSFTGSTDGSDPISALTLGADGNFYGTASTGGSHADGTIFKVTPAGTLAAVHEFANTDGATPNGLLLARDGNFYGTTQIGGIGAGTVFKLTPAGVLTTLHSFGQTDDGATPTAGLVEGTDGNFYGTTYYGGATSQGTVFQITPAGVLTTLYSFGATTTGGQNPDGKLLLGSNGKFYGITQRGGANGFGTIFSITSTGTFADVHDFASDTDGAFPSAALIQGKDNFFYGTTFSGGSTGQGTIFKFSAAGAFTVVHTLTGSEGTNSETALVQGADGNFYGATQTSANGGGTVYQLTPAGVLTVLYDFNGKNGQLVAGSLVQGANGDFYGVTSQGGSTFVSGVNTGDGTVFRLAVVPTPGIIDFAASTYNVNENGGSAAITVSRTGGSSGSVSVAYATGNGTAIAGTDYTAVSGTLSWAAGDATAKTFTVPIANEQLFTGSKTVRLTLSNPTGGATLGTLTQAPLNILDNDAAPQPTIAIISPPPNTSVVSGSIVPFAANVTDPGGLLSKVEFTVNGLPVYSTTGGGPYVKNVPAPAPGQYTVAAIATDTQGRTNTATLVVTVLAPNPTAVAPVAELLTPLQNRNVAAGASLTISAAAAAASSTTLAKVMLYADGVLIATFDANGNPINTDGTGGGTGRPTRRDAGGGVLGLFQTSFTLPGVDQIVNLIAVALDQLGQSSVSSVTSFHSTVTTDRAPLVSLAGIASGTHLSVGSSNTLSVSASDPDAGATPGLGRQDVGVNAIISKVEYYINGVLTGTSTTAPFGFTFTPPSAGKYVLHAVATDGANLGPDGGGLATVSEPVEVEADAVLPTVNLAVGGSGVAVEGGAKGIALVTRTGDTSAALTVSYKAKGSAKAGVDYKTLSGTVVIPAGATKAKIKVKPIDGSPNAGTLKVKLVLLAPADGSYTVGTSPVKIKLIGK